MNVGDSFDSGITAPVIDGEYLSNISLGLWEHAISEYVQIAKVNLVKYE